MEWKKVKGNEILQGEGFYVSFHGDIQGELKRNREFALCEVLGSALFGVKSGDSETALVLTHGEPKWRVLNGDFRQEYEEAFPLGLEACVAVYEKHKAARSGWSTDGRVAPGRGGASNA